MKFKLPDSISFYFILIFDFLFMFFVSVCLIFSILAPLLDLWGYGDLSMEIRRILSPTCHQIEERSFSISGFPCALCVRCTAIYSGIIISRIFMSYDFNGNVKLNPLSLWNLNMPLIVFILMGQMCLHWFLEWASIINSPEMVRFLTGFLFGTGWLFGPYIYMINFIDTLCKRYL